MSAYTAYAPTGVELGAHGLFQGDVGPVEGSVLMYETMEGDGQPLALYKLCDTENAAVNRFGGIVTLQQLDILGTADGGTVCPVVRGLVKALVRGGSGVNLTKLAMHTDGYLIAAAGSYVGDTNAVAELRLADGITHSDDGLALVYAYGPSR